MTLSRSSVGRLNASWLVPATLGLAIVATLAAIIVLSQRVGGDDLRQEAPPFTYTGVAAPFTRLTVQQAGGSKLTVMEDTIPGQPAPSPRDIELGPATRIEVLRPLTRASDVRAGEWLSVVAIPNEVRNFSIHALVVLPAPGELDGDHVRRSAGGFAGGEAGINSADRVVLGGPVERVEGDSVVLRGPTGPVTVQILNNAPLFRLEEGVTADIHDGDRLAVAGLEGGQPRAILVQPAGVP